MIQVNVSIKKEDTRYCISEYFMQCPYCSHKETKVTNKRESPQGIRRRRECLRCKKRFTTYEKQELMDFYVVKKDGRREKFSRDKLFVGVDRAFE
ncbi:MAG: hypothetical protein AABY22_17390, partial [Nanoarchaeota archaeon]